MTTEAKNNSPQYGRSAWQRRLLALMLLPWTGLSLLSCDYDESVGTCQVQVQLVFPEGSTAPREGMRVELKDRRASVFADSTDARGTAHFVVTPGVYEATAAGQVRVYGERYDTLFIYNGVRSQQVVAPENDNRIDLELKVSFRRMFH